MSLQNQRIYEVGWDHWSHIVWLDSLNREGFLEHDTQDYVQTTCQYVQKRRLCKFLGQSALMVSHSHCKVFPHIQVELPVRQFLTIASCLIAWHHQEE